MKQRLHYFLLVVSSLFALHTLHAQRGAYRFYTDEDKTTTLYYNTDAAVSLPSTIGGKTITHMQPIVAGEIASEPIRQKTTRIVIDPSMLAHDMTSLSNLFRDFTKVTTIENLSNLKTEGVTSMQEMFRNCSQLTSANVSAFKTDDVTSLYAMFYDCQALTSLDISQWKTSKVKNMEALFGNCYALTSLDVSKLDTKEATTLKFMFFGCKKLPVIDVSKFVTDKVTDMHGMFYLCESVARLDVDKFNTTNIKDMSFMFRECRKLTHLDVSKFDTQNVENMYSMFFACNVLPTIDVSGFDTRKVKRMDYMFGDCKALTSLDFSNPNFVTNNVTNMEGMFRDCGKLAAPNLSRFNTEKVTSMKAMFRNCSAFATLDVSSFRTPEVTSMEEMFMNCSQLKELNVSAFRTPKVKNMRSMFNGLSNVKVLDVKAFDTKEVTNMWALFHQCVNLRELDLSQWNTAKVTDMGFMFGACKYLKTLDLNSFSGAALTQVEGMFSTTDNMEYIDLHRGQNFADDKLTAMATSAPNAFTLKYWPQGSSVTGRNIINYDGSNFTAVEYYVSDDTLTRYTSDLPSANEPAAMKWEINIPYAFKAAKVTNTRQIAGVDKRAYTWYMPYSAPLPANADVYEFATTTVNGIVATFVPTTDTQLDAQKPYLIVGKGSAIATSTTTEQSVKQYTPGTDVEAGATSGEWKYIGTFQWRTIKQAADQGLYGLLSNYWKTYVAGTRRPQPLRAHLKNTAVVPSGAPNIAIAFDNNTTGLQKIELLDTNSPENSRIYDLNGNYLGTRRDLLRSGLYIIDGQKVRVQ